MPVKTSTEFGNLIIDDSVFATLAGMSAMESYGIVGMAAKDAKDGLFELLKTESLTKGIKVSIRDNFVSIDMYVILEYGIKISVVCKNIIDKVKFNIETFTGLRVDKVNVNVQGIRIDK
ncbi:MAG: Asp23/Gls24 family envelope stress response protein [Gudongella sp.]|nr:Asp23/Gls24 family envelope stress response protein [Gudongella sp.]